MPLCPPHLCQGHPQEQDLARWVRGCSCCAFTQHPETQVLLLCPFDRWAGGSSHPDHCRNLWLVFLLCVPKQKTFLTCAQILSLLWSMPSTVCWVLLVSFKVSAWGVQWPTQALQERLPTTFSSSSLLQSSSSPVHSQCPNPFLPVSSSSSVLCSNVQCLRKNFF